MVGSTGTLMTMRLVRSKLRKREGSTTASPGSIESQHAVNFAPQNRANSTGNTCDRQHQGQQQILTTTASLVECNNANNQHNHQNNNNINITNNNNNRNNDSQPRVTFSRTSGVGATSTTTATATPLTNNWVFPPKAPTPNIYNCMNNDALLAANDKNGFKGFRKQFSGRFKRFVAKKPEPMCVIPPELKPQLKTIYVY